ncbi:MAG: insulinase family protein [Vicingaceae bacterium]
MRKLNLILLISIVFLIACGDKTESKKETYKYKYERPENDPLNTFIYTLDNGLKVYMSVNKEEPRIQTNIAVNTGSKQDPSDATGLAHYLEHMLFKGTSKLATNNWEEEKKLLQQISDLYEKRRTTTDELERKKIYHQIDSLSNIASQYAIPNEYDKLISSLGAKGTNAYTSLEQTVYINDIPSNELERWLKIESERFSELVLRLFHTELEAVYEEFNIGQDEDSRQAIEALLKGMFKKHPYGTQTTIGTGEHLKNPSMEKIHEYFSQRYVPNNMAIILSGDIDPDKTVALVEKYFGHYKAKEVPKFTFEPEEEQTEPEIIDVFGHDAEFVAIGFRLPGIHEKDIYMLNLFNDILTNGQAGLIDLDLIQSQKVIDASCFSWINNDYSMFIMEGVPREGQSLEEVRALLLEEIEKVKKGEFDDWLIDAVIKNQKLDFEQQLEYNWIRASELTDAFIYGLEKSPTALYFEKVKGITKKDIVDFANKYFKNNYVVVNKKIGDPNSYKVEKPEITHVQLNRDMQSDFAKEIENMPETRLEPVFIDYKKEIKQSKVKNNIPLYYVENTTNSVFSLSYILDMGEWSDKDLGLAVEYLQYLGTDKYTPEELKIEFYKLGLDYDVYVADERIYVTLNGLEESFEKGIELFEHILAHVKPDQEAYDKFVEGILKERKDAKLNQFNILFYGLSNYGKYGPDNPHKFIIPEEELKTKDINLLAEKIKSLTSYKHYIYFYGSSDVDKVSSVINKFHNVPETLKDLLPAKNFVELPTEKNKVLFTHYDMVQTEVLFLNNAGKFNPDLLSISRLFNEYFGSGLSSIVFQEIRESKALAYSAYAGYRNPNKKERNAYVTGYVGTQVDKLKDALDAMLAILNDMPEAKDQFEDAKTAALKKIETSRIKRSSIFWQYLNNKELGFDYDINQDIYKRLKTYELKDLKSFFDQNIKGKKYTFLVIGDKNKINKQALKELGEMQELDLKEIYGY